MLLSIWPETQLVPLNVGGFDVCDENIETVFAVFPNKQTMYLAEPFSGVFHGIFLDNFAYKSVFSIPNDDPTFNYE